MMHLIISILGGMAGGVIGIYLLFKISDHLDRKKDC